MASVSFLSFIPLITVDAPVFKVTLGFYKALPVLRDWQGPFSVMTHEKDLEASDVYV